MALDLQTVLGGKGYIGLSPSQSLAMLKSLQNQMTVNPGNYKQYYDQMSEIFGPEITQQVSDEARASIQQPFSSNGAIPPQTSTNSPPPPTGNTLPPPTNQFLDPLPGAPVAPNNPYGGLYNPGMNPTYGDAQGDVERLVAEAELQKNLSQQTLQSQYQARSKYLTDLSGLLQQQQSQQLTQALPGVYEDLNTRGLLRSSALGNELGQRQAALAQETSNQLAKQGLSYSDQYTSGLGNIENTYLGARNAALSRRFSLEDLGTNIQASKDLGFALQPAKQEAPKNAAVPAAGIGAVGQIAAAGK